MDIIYQRPKWIPIIYDKYQEVKGRILMSYCLIDNKHRDEVVNGSIEPRYEPVYLKMYPLGLRNVKTGVGEFMKSQFTEVELKFSCFNRIGDDDSEDEVENAKADKRKEGGNADQSSNIQNELNASAEKQAAVGSAGNSGAEAGHGGSEVKLQKKDLRKFKISGNYGRYTQDQIEAMYKKGFTVSQSDYATLTREQKKEVKAAEKDLSASFRNIPKSRIVDNSLNVPINDKVDSVVLHVPYNKAVCPVLELFMYDYPRGNKQLYATGTFSMRQTLAWFYGDEDDKEYRDRWNKFFRINKGDANLDKEKPIKVKAPKVKAENQLLYLDDLIYELPNADQFKSKRVQRRERWMENEEQRKRDEKETVAQGKIPKPKKQVRPDGPKDDLSFENLYDQTIIHLMPEDSELDIEERKKVAFDLYKRGYFKDGLEYQGQDNDDLYTPAHGVTPGVKSQTVDYTPSVLAPQQSMANIGMINENMAGSQASLDNPNKSDAEKE